MTGDRAIGLLLHPRERASSGAVAEAARRARAHGFDTWVTAHDVTRVLEERRDATALLVTVGGDGTFLLGARLAAPLGIPVLGVNRGQLGFLTDVELADLPDAIDDVARGQHRLQRRTLIDVAVASDPDGGSEGFRSLAVNEVAVKSAGVNLVRIRVEADGELLGEFDSDGVIVATPMGSTAYALSAGGPPVDPRVRALVIVPLAAHAVFTRAVIVPDAVVVHLTVVHGRGFVWADGHPASAEGLGGIPLSEGSQLEVQAGPELQVVRVTGSAPFLRRLREKLHFGVPLKETLPVEEDGG